MIMSRCCVQSLLVLNPWAKVWNVFGLSKKNKGLLLNGKALASWKEPNASIGNHAKILILIINALNTIAYTRHHLVRNRFQEVAKNRNG